MRRRRLHEDTEKTARLIRPLRENLRPLQTPADLDPLMDRIGAAPYVLLGEASHGTAEYYQWRAALSRRLIEEKGFSFIAVEGDWPDCYRVNRYLKGRDGTGETAHDVLHAFERWPTWMWANDEIVALAEWLRQYNDGRPEAERVGFYGLDVYSLWDSLYAVLSYVQKHEPNVLPAARRAFQCFEPYGEDAQDYARATTWASASCENEVVALLAALRRQVPDFPDDGAESRFNAEQNALVVQNAEAYYRTMVQGGPESWNIRDRHMVQTLERLMLHHGPTAKCIVWEHNTHIGDARATDMADEGMVNVGQLVRETHAAQDVVLVGFGSYEGSVIAGKDWEAPMRRMPVPPARPGSWEQLLHEAGEGGDGLVLTHELGGERRFHERRGHRAIGVVYHPQYEHLGNYVPTVLPRRYDAFLYLDHTRALHPLHLPTVEQREVPETYPSGV